APRAPKAPEVSVPASVPAPVPASVPASVVAGEGDLLEITRRKAPFYIYNPGFAPDELLEKGTRVVLVEHGKIWSDVRLPSGMVGCVANDFMVEVEELAPPASLSASSSSSAPYRFEYGEVSADIEPPALPETSGGLRFQNALLPPVE
ncbi:MAG: hypothetical protein ACC661_08505, partial [Verrucomicrobiales bacterium]